MASAPEVQAAINAVRAGTANADQSNLVARAAQQSGSVGNQAREAQSGRR